MTIDQDVETVRDWVTYQRDLDKEALNRSEVQEANDVLAALARILAHIDMLESIQHDRDQEAFARITELEAELERLQYNFTLADVARQKAEAEVERLVVVVDNAEQRAEEAEATVDALRAALLHIVDSTHPADNAYSVARRALGEEA